MSLKNAYREKMEAQLEEQRARLELLKAKAKRAVADGKIMAYEELADAESKFTSAKAKLKELAAASEGAWEEMKGGVETAWHSLSESCKKAAEKFKGEP
jgi:predicted kinase